MYRIINFKQVEGHPRMWTFTLSMCGMLVNGFTYVLPEFGDKKPAVMVPTGYQKRRVVRMWGRTAARMLARLRNLHARAQSLNQNAPINEEVE